MLCEVLGLGIDGVGGCGMLGVGGCGMLGVGGVGCGTLGVDGLVGCGGCGVGSVGCCIDDVDEQACTTRARSAGVTKLSLLGMRMFIAGPMLKTVHATSR